MSDALVQWDPLALLRVACGLFFIPHILGKVLPPHPALGFFKAAKFPQPAVVMYSAAVVETLVCIGLVFGIQTQRTALLGAAVLIVAAGAVLKVGGQSKWLWNFNGIEYPVFWALLCLYIARMYGDVAPVAGLASAS
ncbi:MAG: DoxX family protein [Steroidobacteraceae bacterium]